MTTLLQIGLGNAVLAGLIAVLALAAGRWSRRPALAHSLWLLVLLKLVTPPLVLPRLAWLPPEPTAPTPAPQLAPAPALNDGSATYLVVYDHVPAASPDAVAAVPTPSPWPARLTIAAGVVWLLGTVLVLGRAAIHVRRFQRLLRFGRTAPPEILAEAATLASRLGLRRCPDVVLLPGAVPPLVWAGWGRPSVYLPEVLLERLDDEQRAALLAHELAHVGRRDHWVRRVELLAVALYWWYPLVWWARHQLQAHEEECCDAWVAAELSPRAYATAILETLDFLAETGTGVPVLASGLGRVHALKRRLTLILAGGTPRGLTASVRLGVLAIAGLLLPLVPVVARMAPPAPEPAPAPPEHAALPEPKVRETTQTIAVALTNLQANQAEIRNLQYTVDLEGETRWVVSEFESDREKKQAVLARIKSMKRSADGQYYIVVWATPEGQQVTALPDQKEIVLRLALSPDGRELAAENGKPRTVSVVDGSSGKVLSTVAQAVVNPTRVRSNFIFVPEPDEAFLRRLYLDLAGRVPSEAETRSFLTAEQAVRRQQLVERLRKEHPERFQRAVPSSTPAPYQAITPPAFAVPAVVPAPPVEVLPTNAR